MPGLGVALEIESYGERDGIDARKARELLKVAEEAAANAVRHGRPERLHVRLGWHEGVTLRIDDDGAGFDVAAPSKGTGLNSMRRRADQLQGVLEVRSRLDEGTSLELKVPQP